MLASSAEEVGGHSVLSNSINSYEPQMLKAVADSIEAPHMEGNLQMRKHRGYP